jgi:hypothetical protein
MIKKFIQESWNEYLSFFKNNFKNKKRRLWMILLIIFVEISLFLFTIYGGYQLFNYFKG